MTHAVRDLDRWALIAACGAVVAGLSLHITTMILAEGEWSSFLLQLLALSSAPYGIVALMLWWWRRPLVSAVAAGAVLAADLWAFASAIVWPTDAQAALILLWMPIWNSLFILPIATLLGWWLDRRRRRARDGSTWRTGGR